MPVYADKAPYTMGINGVVVRRAGTAVAFAAAGGMKITPAMVSGTLRGSGAIRSVQSYLEGADGEFMIGGWPLGAVPLMTGMAAPSASGSTPNQVTQYSFLASTSYPYFEVYAKALKDDGQGAVMIWVPQAKITKGFTIEMKDGGTFVAPSVSFTCVPNSSNIAMAFFDDETARAISAIYPAGTTLTATGAAATANVVTLTFGSAHSLAAGQVVTIAGCTEAYAAAVNGLKELIAVPSSTTATFAAVGAGTDASVSGTITLSY